MVSWNQYLLFLGVSLLIICTPGQDTALTIRNTLRGRRRAGIATAFGVAAGQATWTVATSAGLSALMAASETLFSVVRILGAAYLLYLGIRSLFSALTASREQPEQLSRPGSLSPRTALLQGFVSNLSNVKMLAFFTGLLPPFAGAHPDYAVLLALGFNFSLLTFAWLTAYAVAVDRMNQVLGRAAVRRAIEGIVGTVLVGLGIRIGSEALQ